MKAYRVYVLSATWPTVGDEVAHFDYPTKTEGRRALRRIEAARLGKHETFVTYDWKDLDLEREYIEDMDDDR